VDSAPVGSAQPGSAAPRGWTENGVDVTIPLRVDNMHRLLQDLLLLP
jgi:hypothetical protein